MSIQSNRMYRVNLLLSRIKVSMIPERILPEEKLSAEFCRTYGIARRTFLEYLNELENSGEIVRTDGKVWTKDWFDQHEDYIRSLEEDAAKEEKGVNL